MTNPTIGHDDSGLNLPTYAPLRFPIETPPAYGEFIEVTPEIYWLRGSMPMALNHINVYLIKDGDGWTVLDTGIATPQIQQGWRDMLGRLGGGPVKRVIVTSDDPHRHPAGSFPAEVEVGEEARVLPTRCRGHEAQRGRRKERREEQQQERTQHEVDHRPHRARGARGAAPPSRCGGTRPRSASAARTLQPSTF